MTRSRALSSALLGATLFALGCDGGSSGADGGGRDASDPGLDAARPDAARPDGGGPDEDAGGGLDAGPPDSGPPEPCDSPGEIETVACGSCGTVERFCTSSLTWAYGTCEGGGGCAPGSTETVACGNCGEQMRRCTASCEWEDVGTCGSEGECAPGATATRGDGCPSGELRDFTCNTACTFEPTSACMSAGCDTPGATEDVACGLCGTRTRFCTIDRVWEYDECDGEGVCTPGTTGEEACGMCGTQATRCNTECLWVPASGASCEGEGVCTPGERRRTDAGCPAGQTRLLECGAGCGYTIVAEPCTATVPVDVLFVVDGTASHFFNFQDRVATFVPRCVDALLALDDVYVGLAWYGDFDFDPTPFVGAVELGPVTSSAIGANIGAFDSIGGGDDSTMEMLSIVTGGTPAAGSVPFTCSSGRTAGGCWRPGAQRVIVMSTDENARGGPDPAGTGLWNPWPSGADWTTVEPRLEADDALLYILLHDDTGGSPLPSAQYAEMLSDLGQPSTDLQIEASDSDVTAIGPLCDTLVARVRALAGL